MAMTMNTNKGKNGGEICSNGPANETSLIDLSVEQKLWDSYNYLLTCPDVDRLRKIMARTELFRMTIDVPGDIVECGVFKGTGFMHFLKLRQIFLSGTTKRVIGFDVFDSVLHLDDKEQQKRMDDLYQISNFKGISTEKLTEVGKAITKDTSVFEFVKGDICVTAEKYAENNPGFRISFLHMDLDVAEPTLGALEALWPQVSRGGVVVFDEYAVPRWSESQAVDKFFADKPEVMIKSMPWANTPTAYCIKP